jgi:hypothetical protein
VAQHGGALRFASGELRANKELVLNAVSQAPREFDDNMAEHLQSVQVKTQVVGGALQFASSELRANKELALVAVARDGLSLRFASAEVRADKEVVLAAVAQHGEALKHASAELKVDREVVLTACARTWSAIQCASPELRNDYEVLLAAVLQNDIALLYSSVKREDFNVFVRGRLVAHHAFTAFLFCAVRPTASPTGALRSSPPATSFAAAWKLEDLGEDAGSHVKLLVAGFAGTPCGRPWANTRAVHDASQRTRAIYRSAVGDDYPEC